MIRTIYALSSGRPPAAIAVVRVSGPQASAAGAALAGTLPPPRRAALRRLRSRDGTTLDQALTLFFPGPDTATGEDLVELHLHGGRAVVAAVEAELALHPGLFAAQPGEFTRQSLANGRLDLAQTEGLADLLEAETEAQRRAALAMAEGDLSRMIAGWLGRLGMIAAGVEAALDFSDEDDVATAASPDVAAQVRPLVDEMNAVLVRPPVERLRDGVVVVIAGPRNAGKSSLFNALLGRDAAIVTDIAGTTRDLLEASVSRQGMPFRLVDTAGLTDRTDDPVEALGILRAQNILCTADIVLWLGDPAAAPSSAICVKAKSDTDADAACGVGLRVSIHDPSTIDKLWDALSAHGATMLDVDNAPLLRTRHIALLVSALEELVAIDGTDLLMDAERLRIANVALAAVVGHDATEAMLDALFSRFCIGK